MAFSTKPNPTFSATLTIIGQGREQKLDLVFRHMSKAKYAELFDELANGKLKPEEAVIKLVESWDADAELTADGVRAVIDDMPGFDWAIVTGYGEALVVERRKN